MTEENDLMSYSPIEAVETYMATDLSVVEDQIRANLKRELTEIEYLPEFMKTKGNHPVAIAGGGPSIKYTVEQLKHFKVVIACGSAHDWLVENGVIPTYTLILDPDIISANYLKHPQVTCNYLVASSCHPKVFDILEGYPVTRWHPAGSSVEFYEKAWEDANIKGTDKKPIIGGGCTCGLRAISIAMLFGYRNLHFFGLDSNLDMNTGEHHAYEFVDKENETLGDVIEMKLGDGKNGRRFFVAKYMMAQLWGFKDLITGFGDRFDVTVHGDSIIYEFVRLRKLIAKKKKENEQQ